MQKAFERPGSEDREGGRRVVGVCRSLSGRARVMGRGPPANGSVPSGSRVVAPRGLPSPGRTWVSLVLMTACVGAGGHALVRLGAATR